MSFQLKSTTFRRLATSLAIALVAAFYYGPTKSRAAETLELRIGDAIYIAELATTSAQRGRGLMYRPTLAADRGMLLVYPRDDDHAIWMKNMRIALRVYWIDRNHRVVAARRLEPCAQNPCPIYRPGTESRYVLELADREHPIEIGDPVAGLTPP